MLWIRDHVLSRPKFNRERSMCDSVCPAATSKSDSIQRYKPFFACVRVSLWRSKSKYRAKYEIKKQMVDAMCQLCGGKIKLAIRTSHVLRLRAKSKTRQPMRSAARRGAKGRTEVAGYKVPAFCAFLSSSLNNSSPTIELQKVEDHENVLSALQNFFQYQLICTERRNCSSVWTRNPKWHRSWL
jgi:hypothetical protein